MSDLEKYSTDESEFEVTLRVGEEYAKGFTPRDIAQRIGIPTRDVTKHIKKYQELVRWAAKSEISIVDKIQLVIEEVDQHYKMVVNEAWKNKEQADFNGQTSVVNQSLSLIAKVQSQRAKMFQEFTNGADAEVLNQLEEQQQQQELIIDILKDLKTRFPQAAAYIQDRLQKLTNEIDEVDVEIIPHGNKTKGERE